MTTPTTRPAIPARQTRNLAASREGSPQTLLRGNTGSGTQTVFARAAKLTQNAQTGRSTLSAELLTIAAKQAKREEPVEIVLVTADAHHSLLMSMPDGLILAAVVAEWETDPRFSLPPGLTVVAGVGGAKDAIAEGEWVIVDPVRLRVTVAPDAASIGRLQHKTRERYRLGAAQAVAKTLSGTTVPVWARVFTLDDLREAVESGADGFVMDGPGDFLPWDAPAHESDTAVFHRLLPVADAAGGGDVALLAPLDAVDAAVLVRLAAVCRLRLFLSPDALPLPPLELRAELSAIAEDEMDAGRLAAAPQLVALLPNAPRANDADTDPDEWRGFGETVFLPFDDAEIHALSLSDVLTVPPLWAFVGGGDDWEDTVCAAVFAGLRGVIVAPAQVAQAKIIIAAQE